MQRTTSWGQMKMPVVSIVWLSSLVVLIMGTYNEIPIAAYSVFAVIALLFFIGSDRLAFLFYVVLTVGTVFALLVVAFRDNWSPLTQGLAMGLHFLLLVHLFALYSLSKYVYEFRSENYFLKERILHLEGFISEEGVLPRLEFEKQASFILATMARRKETGYFVQIDLSELPRMTKRTALLTAGSILHTESRMHFDIVGKTGEFKLTILLQNTDAEGMAIVKGRIEERLKETFHENVLEKMKWSATQIEGQTALPEGVLT
ncbi:hypothetical protein M3193_08995 [Sporosarcina luteola]|uniref:hypothetical protein n=1 Tax=Sporosarcina luteola TaxID=582850 RepID=UPI00203F56BC|nr:hypothetical protein [Sporosarcina luteola]MCM3744277.1 hypothetical protein [Sporosarcina luteola]